MKLVCLSYRLNEESPLYGDTPKPSIRSTNSMKRGDNSNGFRISVSNHSGTHVDAPAHFTEGGKAIWEYGPGELAFKRPQVLEIPKEAGEWIGPDDLEGRISEECDCLLIRTGFWEKRGMPVYRENNPGISPEAFDYLRKTCKSVRAVGIDTISITGFQDRPRGRVAHRRAFEAKEGYGEPLLVIEDMDLSEVPEKIEKILLVPWGVEGIDSSPCTVLAECGDGQ